MLIIDLDLSGGDPYNLMAIEGNLSFGTEMFLSEVDWTGSHWVQIGDGQSPGSYDFCMAVSNCVQLQDGPNVLCTFRGILTEEAANLFVGIGPANVSSFDSEGPGWVTCGDFEGYLFEPDGPPRSLNINGTVAVESESWAGIKNLYRN